MTSNLAGTGFVLAIWKSSIVDLGHHTVPRLKLLEIPMQKIAIICAFLIVVMAAVVGLLVIFEMMSFESGVTNMLKYGGAIAVLGVASALISLMMGSKKGEE
jgi:hypothetical protein